MKFLKINVLENWLTSIVGVAGYVLLYGQQTLDFLHTHQIHDFKSLKMALVALALGLVTRHK